jgi:hypothetical protein
MQCITSSAQGLPRITRTTVVEDQEDTGFGGKRGETIGGNQNVLNANCEAFS